MIAKLLLLYVGMILGATATGAVLWAATVREFADACDEHLLPILGGATERK